MSIVQRIQNINLIYNSIGKLPNKNSLKKLVAYIYEILPELEKINPEKSAEITSSLELLNSIGNKTILSKIMNILNEISSSITLKEKFKIRELSPDIGVYNINKILNPYWISQFQFILSETKTNYNDMTALEFLQKHKDYFTWVLISDSKIISYMTFKKVNMNGRNEKLLTISSYINADANKNVEESVYLAFAGSLSSKSKELYILFKKTGFDILLETIINNYYPIIEYFYLETDSKKGKTATLRFNLHNLTEVKKENYPEVRKTLGSRYFWDNRVVILKINSF